MTNLEQIQEQVDNCTKRLAFLDRLHHFVSRYEAILAELTLGWDSSPYLDRPSITVFDDSAVAVFGKIFGTEGWKRKLSGTSKYSWVKTISDIDIELCQVESFEFIPEVSPKAFPLMLENINLETIE